MDLLIGHIRRLLAVNGPNPTNTGHEGYTFPERREGKDPLNLDSLGPANHRDLPSFIIEAIHSELKATRTTAMAKEMTDGRPDRPGTC